MSLQRSIAPAPSPATQGVQQAVFAATINWSPPLMWHELKERHLEFWDEERMQSFWAGTSFYVPGDSNELSYSLAEVFIKLLSENKQKRYLERFLEHARPEDAGQTAALDILDEIETLERHGHRHLNLQMALENILLQVRSLGLTDKPASAG